MKREMQLCENKQEGRNTASKKDVTLRRRGDDENGNDSNPTKIMLEAGVCRHTPDSSMIFRRVVIVVVLVITYKKSVF